MTGLISESSPICQQTSDQNPTSYSPNYIGQFTHRFPDLAITASFFDVVSDCHFEPFNCFSIQLNASHNFANWCDVPPGQVTIQPVAGLADSIVYFIFRLSN